MAESVAPLIHPSRIVNRWAQLIAGIIAMMAIANLQYAWTLFTKPMQAHLHATLTAIQGIFSLFILVETWLVPFEGYLVDRIGPRLMLGAGGILVGLGWILSGQAETLGGLYFWYCLGGVGAGIVYGGTIGNALKWFPDHRGLCVGLTAGAYGIGTALTVAPIDKMIKASGYQHTLVVWGIIQGFVVLIAALFLARPPAGWTPPDWAEKELKIKQHVRSSAVDMTPQQMLRQPSFYVIYLMMTMLSFGGLVVTAQLNPMAVSYHIDKVVVAFCMTWATTNYGIVYTAKGAGALFAGFGAAWLFEKTGSWTKVFWAMIACDLIAAFLALFWLKPVAARTVEKSISSLQAVDMTAPAKARGVA